MSVDTQDPNLTELLDGVVEAAAQAIRVAGPGVITAVAGSRASVQPAVRRTGAEGDEPVVGDVPLCFPRTGCAGLSLPVEAGDQVLLVHADRSIAEWQAAGGGQVEAEDPRGHDLADALAFPLSLGSLVSGRDNDVSLSRDSETTGRAEVRLAKGSLTESPGDGVSPGSAKLALGVAGCSGTYFEPSTGNHIPFTGAVEVVDLLIQLMDVLADPLLGNTARVGGSTSIMLINARWDQVIAIRDKLKMIKSTL